MSAIRSAPSESTPLRGLSIGELEGPEIVIDPSEFPHTLNEAPELAALVRQGKLPPVAERIGRDPLVIRPLHAIGRYGGTLRRAISGAADAKNPYNFAAGPDSPLFWDPTGKRVVPNIARAFELTDGDRVVRLHLRRGMRWSDGAPFTADDFTFWYEDILNFKPLVPNAVPVMLVGGKPVAVRKVDMYTVEFVSPLPNPIIVERMANAGQLSGLSVTFSGNPPGFGGYAPKHYLSRFLPKYRSQDELDRLAGEAKLDSWVALFRRKGDWLLNAELPVLTPWKVAVGGEIDKDPFVLERNPYSVWVDVEGNQLPYIGRISHALIEDRDTVARRAADGDYDFLDRYLDPPQLPMLVEHQERGGYTVHLDPGQDADFGVRLNLAYVEDSEIGELLRDVRFRRALSLGIDRDVINETFFLGLATPSSALPGDDTRYFPGTEWRMRWATLDVAQADGLLDEIGLTKRDSEGYRLRRDGRGRLRLMFEATSVTTNAPAIGAMIAEQWREIGIDLVVRDVEAPLFHQRILANQVQMSGAMVSSWNVFEFPDMVVPIVLRASGLIGIPYAKWYLSGGKEGMEPFPELKALMEKYEQGYTAPAEERVRIGREILTTHVDQVFSIGIVAMGLSVYGVHLAKNGLGNVPARMLNSVSIRNLALPQTFYFKERSGNSKMR